jgi:hypothetical protein
MNDDVDARAMDPDTGRRRLRDARTPLTGAILGTCALLLLSCEPTVKLEAPDEPIVINLNVKIEQEVRVRIEESAERDIATNPDIF